MAATLHELLISSAGVSITASSTAYSQAYGKITTRKASAAVVASKSKNARLAGAILLTRAVMRMCSPRLKAMAEPTIASHRNSIEASSSDQISGWRNT